MCTENFSQKLNSHNCKYLLAFSATQMQKTAPVLQAPLQPLSSCWLWIHFTLSLQRRKSNTKMAFMLKSLSLMNKLRVFNCSCLTQTEHVYVFFWCYPIKRDKESWFNPYVSEAHSWSFQREMHPWDSTLDSGSLCQSIVLSHPVLRRLSCFLSLLYRNWCLKSFSRAKAIRGRTDKNAFPVQY